MSRILSIVVILLLCRFSISGELDPTPGKQIATSVTVHSGGEPAEEVTVPLLLYTPEGYQPDGAPWPLLLFLHGYGECGDGGDEIQRVAIHGPASQVAAGRSLPFVVVTPQCPKPTETELIRKAWRPDVLIPLLDLVQSEMNIDDRRVYLTGLSMGGFGSWRLAAAAPERFAAVVPICGGGEPETMASALASLPVWAFHGAKDNTVKLALSSEMVDAVKTAGGNARLTVYPEAGHNSWSATYDNPMFYDWLLGIRRTSSE